MNTFPLKLARKYVFSGKNAIEVNVISWIAFLALGFVTICLLVIISVFAGLENLNLQFYSEVNPNVKIIPTKGKTFVANKDLQEKFAQINKLEDVKALSYVVEERAFITYSGKNHIITLKGVDENFNKIFNMDTMVRIGNPLEAKYPDEIIVGSGVSSRLSLYANPDDPLELYVPKPGKGMITNAEKAFHSVTAYNTGIFFINDKYEEYAFSNLSLAQKLLNYTPHQFSYVEVKSNNQNDKKLKAKIQQVLGAGFQVQTRQEIDSAFLKMMNTENLMIYLIFILILIIASFNLAGSIAILILDKRSESKTLRSMGYNNRDLRKTYFTTGMLITIYALVFGILLGSFVAWLQYKFELVMVSAYVAFPVKFTFQNYLITILSVLGIGAFVSWFVSRNAKIETT